MPRLCPLPIPGTVVARPSGVKGSGGGIYYAQDAGIVSFGDEDGNWWTPAGQLLARTQYAPSAMTTYNVVVATTGVTALDTTNLKVTFVAPYSGNVLVRLQALVNGPSAAATATRFAVVSTTGSPGTLVGLVGLVNVSPTSAAGDNDQLCTYDQVITGLTPGTSYIWYFAASYVGTQSHVQAQGGITNTSTPGGAPALIEVFSA